MSCMTLSDMNQICLATAMHRSSMQAFHVQEDLTFLLALSRRLFVCMETLIGFLGAQGASSLTGATAGETIGAMMEALLPHLLPPLQQVFPMQVK